MITHIPKLATISSTPLTSLETLLLSNQDTIEEWFSKKTLEHQFPIYSSVDIRNSGFKLIPVDNNLFPCGFNNLSKASLPDCIESAKASINKHFDSVKKVLLIPESHTRNIFYLENLAVLRDILLGAGFEVRIGSLLEGLENDGHFDLPSGESVHLEPLVRNDNSVGLKDFDPDLIFLNNDLSSDVPEILRDLDQNITPPVLVGWQNRSKTTYFHCYAEICNELSELIDVDPWLLSPYFKNCGKVDFLKHEGEQCLMKFSREVLSAIEKKYREHGIQEKPFIIIKADSGSYGMGVMTIYDADEIVDLNRKRRTHMSTSKGGQHITQVIIQEGVHTVEAWGKETAPAEPAVYLFGSDIVGGFYRINPTREIDENLNAPGMYFEPMTLADESDDRFYAYSVIARLASLAAALEQKIYEERG